jgi:Pyruvate/2-oxoacid:ferredoxin oxidoreductase gamma subunit
MQDKSFRQALLDVENRIAKDFHASINSMLLHQTNVTHATRAIEDENVRALVTNMIMTGQIVVLLGLLKDLHLLDEVQYNELTAYLLRSARS